MKSTSALAGIITNAGTCLRMLGADPPDVEGARETARRTIRDGNRAPHVMTRLRATNSGGMGIGLFVSRSIVETHEGRLWAEPNDGPGATFSFSIPFQRA